MVMMKIVCIYIHTFSHIHIFAYMLVCACVCLYTQIYERRSKEEACKKKMEPEEVARHANTGTGTEVVIPHTTTTRARQLSCTTSFRIS